MKKFVTVCVQLFLLCHLPTIFETSALISPYWVLESDGTYRGLRSELQKGSSRADNNVEGKILSDLNYFMLYFLYKSPKLNRK